MPILLYRVDERLIHGQVTVGWGNALRPERIIVVDDALAESGWEQELYRLGLPEGISVVFASVGRAREALPGWRVDPCRSILLVRSLDVMRRVAEGGALAGEAVNIGGIHYAPGRRPVLPYVFLGEEERRELRALASEGVEVTAQDLPGSRRVGLRELLR